MRKRLAILALHAVFWMSFMLVSRIAFLLYNHDLTAQLSSSEIFRCIWNGFRMDLSVTGYLLMFTGLALAVSIISVPHILSIFIRTVNAAFIVLSSTVVTVDLELYRQWGFRMNATPLFYLSREGLQSAQPGTTMILLAILTLITGGALAVYFIFIAPKKERLEKGRAVSMIPFIALTAAMIIPIRGSFTVAPMNTGTVYFDKKHPFANHAGINVVWNFMYSLRDNGHRQYPEDLLDRAATESHFAQMMENPDSTVHLLDTLRPNIILIIVESLTADVIEPLGGMPGITPQFTRLAEKGVLFDSLYATGDRTDKGVLGVLSGYPALPLTSTTKYPEKTRHLPMLPITLNAMGYHSSFLYGGDPDFANLRSYLVNAGFDHLTSLDDFPSGFNTAKWGVRDEHLFERAETELDTANQPFFKTILTLSSHEPFDVPRLLPVNESSEESLFLNSLHYADLCIGHFIDWCAQQVWWRSTVVILVADHGHRMPGNKTLQVRERFRIPMLWLGGALSDPTVVHTIGSQTDIANTLLGQLQAFDSKFLFSRNLLADPPTSFAEYFFNNGYGYVNAEHYLIYDHTGGHFVRDDGLPADSQVVTDSKAYAQKLYVDYNRR